MSPISIRNVLFLIQIETLLGVFVIRAEQDQQGCSDNGVPFPSYGCKSWYQSYKDAYNYLHSNLPSWDLTNKASLGFHEDTDPGVDGLDTGVATLGINISLETKQKYFWAANVSEEIFNEFVVTYAHVNEARNNWRPYLTEVVDRILSDHLDITDTNLEIEDLIRTINENMWVRSYLGNDVVFKSSQTPLIYDPMSAIVFGFASCTGVSILFADALKSAGIPARVAGTPAWNGDPESGNHNWIEVFDHRSQEWHFIEASPAGSGETLANPCDKWFCSPDKMKGGTQVFASRWSQSSETVYQMAWDIRNTEVPGVNRTDYYQTACNKC